MLYLHLKALNCIMFIIINYFHIILNFLDIILIHIFVKFYLSQCFLNCLFILLYLIKKLFNS